MNGCASELHDNKMMQVMMKVLPRVRQDTGERETLKVLHHIKHLLRISVLFVSQLSGNSSRFSNVKICCYENPLTGLMNLTEHTVTALIVFTPLCSIKLLMSFYDGDSCLLHDALS